MFKKAVQQVRKVITEFTCKGFGACALEDIVVVSAGLPMPPIVELCSEEYTGEIPRDAKRYDQAAHAAYLRDNAVRPEPPATVWWNEADVKKNLRLSDSQFATAKASGFPKSNGRRDLFDRDGVPVGSEPLRTSELAQNWDKSIRTLTTVGRR